MSAPQEVECPVCGVQPGALCALTGHEATPRLDADGRVIGLSGEGDYVGGHWYHGARLARAETQAALTM